MKLIEASKQKRRVRPTCSGWCDDWITPNCDEFAIGFKWETGEPVIPSIVLSWVFADWEWEIEPELTEQGGASIDMVRDPITEEVKDLREKLEEMHGTIRTIRDMASTIHNNQIGGWISMSELKRIIAKENK